MNVAGLFMLTGKYEKLISSMISPVSVRLFIPWPGLFHRGSCGLQEAKSL